jgi:hypothetical protein
MSFQDRPSAVKAFWADIKGNKTLWVQIPIAVLALSIAAISAAFTVTTFRQERNAKLVEIGVSILKADPTKEPDTIQAREWALDLIDANAGGVKFSKKAREELLRKALPIGDFIPGGGTSRGHGATAPF